MVDQERTEKRGAGQEVPERRGVHTLARSPFRNE